MKLVGLHKTLVYTVFLHMKLVGLRKTLVYTVFLHMKLVGLRKTLVYTVFPYEVSGFTSYTVFLHMKLVGLHKTLVYTVFLHMKLVGLRKTLVYTVFLHMKLVGYIKHWYTLMAYYKHTASHYAFLAFSIRRSLVIIIHNVYIHKYKYKNRVSSYEVSGASKIKTVYTVFLHMKLVGLRKTLVYTTSYVSSYEVSGFT